MSGPVKLDKVHSCVLFLPAGVNPPALPWAEQLSEENPKVPRWIRLDSECHGDGKIMPRNLYALVVDGRDIDDVIASFLHELALPQACDEAVLVVHRALEDGCELYTKQGAPLLLGALRSPTATPLLPALTNEEVLRELVERKVRPK